jgi:hypothetical protein
VQLDHHSNGFEYVEAGAIVFVVLRKRIKPGKTSVRQMVEEGRRF